MRRIVLLGIAVALATTTLRAQATVPTQAKIDAAIDRGVAHLLELYGDGEGRDPLAPPGTTLTLVDQPGLRALTVYTLLKSGVDRRSPVVEKLLARLSFERFVRTYDVACMLLALVAFDPVGERAWIDELAAFLVSHREKAGDFGYPGGGDLSNTQFAAFGLRAAAAAGVAIPTDVWTGLANSVLRFQSKDGGFSYMTGLRSSTDTMSAAGVGTLAICEIELLRAGSLDTSLAQRIRSARSAGLDWLARFAVFQREPDHGSWHHYFLYGVERIGALCAVEKIGTRDWYREGATYLLEHQDDRGDWPGTFERAPTLFALLFLERATTIGAETRSRLAPATGPGPQRLPHTRTTDSAGGTRLEAEGPRPLRAWITRLVSPANASFEWPDERGRGPRVAFVEYLADGKCAAVLLGDPDHPAGEHVFACEPRGLGRGHHELSARVHVRLATNPLADQVITTNSVDVEIAEDAPAAVVAAAFDPELDLVSRARPRATASSVLSKAPGWEGVTFTARQAVDMNPHSPWIASSEDEVPLLRIRMEDPQRANVVRVAPARLEPRTPDFLTLPREISISVNGATARVVALGTEPGSWPEVHFDKPLLVNALEIRLVGRQVPGAAVGVGEIVLQLAPD